MRNYYRSTPTRPRPRFSGNSKDRRATWRAWMRKYPEQLLAFMNTVLSAIAVSLHKERRMWITARLALVEQKYVGKALRLKGSHDADTNRRNNSGKRVERPATEAASAIYAGR